MSEGIVTAIIAACATLGSVLLIPLGRGLWKVITDRRRAKKVLEDTISTAEETIASLKRAFSAKSDEAAALTTALQHARDSSRYWQEESEQWQQSARRWRLEAESCQAERLDEPQSSAS